MHSPAVRIFRLSCVLVLALVVTAPGVQAVDPARVPANK